MEFRPRTWQVKSYNAWSHSYKKHFVNVACPGAGKTSDALMKFYLDRKDGKFQKLIVVSPTQKVRRQWQESAARFGIQITVLKRDVRLDLFDGFSMTYQQLPGFLELVKNYCLSRSVMVVLDEPHHLADERTWGDFAQDAFKNAQRILLATGTPFRSDDARIPFLEYNAIGEGQADFIYGYPEAIIDGYCRVAQFHAIDGEVSWAYGTQADMFEKSANFSDNLQAADASQRLRAALNPDSGFVQEIIKVGVQKLSELREHQKDAGGLAVCMNIKHAKEIADLIMRLTGKQPMLVHSDDENAIRNIDFFAKSDDSWVVSVGMISEGVDIQRLRVLLYLTNVKTAMAFRQILGRVVRRRPGETSEKCYVYLPADENLLAHVKEIEDDINHVLREKEGRFRKDDVEDVEREKKMLVAFEGCAMGKMVFENGVLIVDGQEHIPDVGNMAEYMERLRKEIHHAVAELARRTSRTPRQVNSEWIKRGGKPAKKADVKDLQKKLAWVRGTLAREKTRDYYRQEERRSVFQ